MPGRFKLENIGYHKVKRLQHKGKIGMNNGENIVVHVCNILDDNAHYKTINGKLHVMDLNVRKKVVIGKNGKPIAIEREKKYIPISEHNRRHYPQIRNPL